VDTATFHPEHAPPDMFLRLPRPIQLYVGRVAVEKNIEAFLAAAQPGTKVVVGEGPALEGLRAKFPAAVFLGTRNGDELAACYAGADVFVFPSRTDTFGLVMIEALACGTPVAAYPVPGPIDVLTPLSGAMEPRLEDAIAKALLLTREDCLNAGRAFSWGASADQFLEGLAAIGQLAPPGAKGPVLA
jgi:glycosyltransferase involved in cell wall biosynthesis